MNTRGIKSSVLLNLLCWLICGLHCAAQSTSDFDRGLTAFRAGNYSSAVTLFASAETSSPGTTDALLYEAKCLVHLENFAEADRLLRTYISSHHDSSDALYMLGFVLNRENRPSDSLSIYTTAAAITRPHADDLKVVGLDYVLLDDYADAIKWLEKSVEFDATNKDAWYYLGRAYYTVARLSEAQKAFETVLSLDASDSRAESNLGLILESNGKPADAMEAYRKAIAWQEQSPHPSEQPYVNLGNLLMQQDRITEAREPLEKAVALAPNSAFCHLTLGIYYRKAGRLDLARTELERATQLDPDNAVAHYQLGRLYRDLHAADRAQAEVDRAQAEVDRVQAEFDRAQAEFDRAQAELDRAEAEFDRAATLKDRASHNSSAGPQR
jgi:tetratricopeptide (TPR) repeat protein